MSNFKKVILFVSMIAVLVSSFMLPTFADEADYPLTDPYIDGYNGDVFVYRAERVNLTSFTSFSGTSADAKNVLKSNKTYIVVYVIGLSDGTNVVRFVPNMGNSYINSISYFGMRPSFVNSFDWCGFGFKADGLNTIGQNFQQRGESAIYVNYNTKLIRYYYRESTRVNGTYEDICSTDDFEFVEQRVYTDFDSIYSRSGGSYQSSFTYPTMGITENYISYRAAQGYYDNGITAGIEQGYQNGYDEGYVEGFASAGGSFADVVSNPQVGLGIPDIRVQFPVFPSDDLTLGSSALTNNLMKFAHVSAVGDSLYEGNGIDVYGSVSEMRWLGTLNSDPKKNGWVCTLWNEAQTAILGTLHWDSARDWEWYEGASATEIELISPDDILTNIRLDIWVHGDSTAFIDTAVLNDNGFAITYPFMGEVFYEDGYNNGYDNGLEDGFNGADTSQAWMNLKDTIFVIFDAPFYVISQSLNFELFGINIAGAIISIISVALIVFILKIIIVRLF